MARLNHKGEYWSHLTQVAVIRDQTGTPGSTNVNGVATEGATSIVVDSATNFTDGDIVRIGVRDRLEINQIEGTPSTTMPLRFPLMYAHADNSEFVEQQANDVGNVTDDGCNIEFSGDHNPVRSATKRLVTAYLTGHAEIVVNFSCDGFALENWALALGIAETAVAGSGTSAAPYTLAIDPDDFNTENDLSYRITGARKDGAIVLLDIMGCEVDFTALAVQLRRGESAPIPIRPKATSGVRVSHYSS